MGEKSEIAKGAVDAIIGNSNPKQVQKMLFGVYSDGSPRSLIDAWNGEILSPKQKRKKLYKKKKVKNVKLKL